MLDITQYIYPELVVPNLRARSKEEAIKELVGKLFEIRTDLSEFHAQDDVYAELISRENLQTTCLGQKVAFPHARIKDWPEFTVVFGFSKDGINFKSLDNQPVNFVCLMVSSMDEPYIILQTMSSIIQFFHSANYFEELSKGVEVSWLVTEMKTRLRATKIICAQDIMRPVKGAVKIDASIEEVTRAMHLKHLDVVPVIDADNKFCGQISCCDIFTHGIPNFFKQLNTVSFVRHIDPFEKYFKIKKDLKAGDFLNNESLTIAKDATLLEIVFELAIKNKPKLYIIDEGNLVGEIDRFSIIDKILFF